MLTGPQILDELERRGVKQKQIGQLLGLPSSRTSELYAGTRALKLGEAVALVNKWGLDAPPVTEPIEPEPMQLNERVSRLLVLHVANELGIPFDPEDELVAELALDLQAFARFAQSRAVRVTTATTQSFLQGRIPERRRRRTTIR